MRREITNSQRLEFDQAIRQQLAQLVESDAIRSLAAYCPFDGEPDIMPLCGQLSEKGVDIALPKIAKSGRQMEFHRWEPGQALAINRFGIAEPVDTVKKSIADVELLLLPLVGYDRLGNRIGLGAGYYDRHLEALRDAPVPLRVGVAYSLQEIELIDCHDRDIALQGVVNENGWFTFDR